MIQIIEGSSQSQTLVLDNCIILKINENFQLNSKFPYLTEHISLVKTLVVGNNKKINEENTIAFNILKLNIM